MVLFKELNHIQVVLTVNSSAIEKWLTGKFAGFEIQEYRGLIEVRGTDRRGLQVGA